MDWLRH